MPLNGSGTFTNPYSWTTEANSGNNIDPAKFDTQDSGIATALSNAIYRDGQSTIIANIPWSNQKITELGDATTDQDALNRRSGDARFIRQIGGALSPTTSVSSSAIDLSTSGRHFYKTATTALTWTFSNPASSGLDGFILELTNGGAYAQTWPASVKWPNGVEPTLTTSGTDILVFITRNAGTSWIGKLTMRDVS